jgi:predicted acyltransferase
MSSALTATSVAESPVPSAAPARQRIIAVDALRGFDMFWIVGGQQLVMAFLAIFINPFPDWLDYQFDHVPWIGFSAWDMIMPLFLFIAGVSMPFSIAARAKNSGYAAAYKKIIRRVIILWVLGMMVQGHLLEFDLSKLHFYSNTLQSIAAGYLVAAVLLLHCGLATQLIAVPVLLWIYCLAIVFIPIPGYGAFALDPAHNLPMVIDEFILGSFRDGTPYTWIFSSLGSAATTLLGVHAGHLLKSRLRPSGKFVALVGVGLGCLALGWMWHQWFPIIKHIWTSSMVLWSGGWCFLLLALFYGIIDVAGWRKWSFPFVVIGMNAIAVYVGTHLISFSRISADLIGTAAERFGHVGAFIQAGVAFAMIWLILLYMYRKKTFIRI